MKKPSATPKLPQILEWKLPSFRLPNPMYSVRWRLASETKKNGLPHRIVHRKGCTYRASNAVFVFATEPGLLSNFQAILLFWSLNRPAAPSLLPSSSATNTDKRVCPVFLRSATAGEGGGAWRMLFGEAKYLHKTSKQKAYR